eukprot:CAMPEP_0174696142 /NCGR_PEP_ID=MMETSP1094-20130205/2374_1 /TAXON_ID=156173 /ORGANISM="Chrysochromulina brevifilum, Strain UTEX LB 985" /LENGTH=44 /DNA_ID= /DNA_START= /DNA_END= /DNA_ORIENTATION=
MIVSGDADGREAATALILATFCAIASASAAVGGGGCGGTGLLLR